MFVNEHGEDEIVIRTTGGSNSPLPGEIVFQDSNGDEYDAPFLTQMSEVRIKLPKKRSITLNLKIVKHIHTKGQ